MSKKKQGRRTIRRVSLPLNRGKWEEICRIVGGYADEKDDRLRKFGNDAVFAGCRSDRTIRDDLVKSGYRSPRGLQARMWKLALKDAYETVLRQWAAFPETCLRGKIARQNWNDRQKRYARVIIASPKTFVGFITGHAPNPKFEIPHAEKKPVRNYLRRVTRKKRGERPRVRIARSACFDADMYETFTHNGVRYIRIMTLARGKRLVIPLAGNTVVRGNIRIVLCPDKKRIGVRHTAAIKKKKLTGDVCGLDAGLSEVFTDDLGNKYGAGFGVTVGKISDAVMKKGKERNRLHALSENTDDKKKARNVRKFNLGTKKLRKNRRQARTELGRRISEAVCDVLRKREPSVIVTERLDFRGNHFS